MNDQEQKEIPLKQPFGVIYGILYGIGCGIGGTIFVLLGTGIEVAGPGVLISLILGGILIFLTALNYSELSSSLPVPGGSYSLTKEGIGGFLAFIIGFFLWVANIATFTFSALAFASVITEMISPFFPSFNVPPELLIIIALASIVTTVIVVIRSDRIAVKEVIVLTVILIVIFIIFIVAGIFIAPYTNDGHDIEYLYSGTNFFGVIQMFSLLFIFFTSITSNLAFFNSELKNPSKNILKVNILAIFITLSIYLSITLVVLVNIGNLNDLRNDPVLLARILFKILGPFGFFLMGAAAIISTLIAMNAALGSATSILRALSRDNYLSKKFSEVNKKTNVPTYAIIFSASVAIFLALITNIGFAAEMMSFIYFFGLAFVNLAAVRLRYKRKELVRPFKAPFFPYLPLTVASVCLILAFVLEVNAIIVGLIIFGIGISYYLLTLADKNSIAITLAGIKCFLVIIMGLLIWTVNNFGVFSSSISGFEVVFQLILLRILIFIGIFTIGTILFDLIPLKKMVYFVVSKVDKEKVAITLGDAQIIQLEKQKLKIIYNINLILGIVQIISSIFVFTIIFLFGIDIISIEKITIMNTIIPEVTADYLFMATLIIFAIVLLLSGFLSISLNREMKVLGI